MPVDSEIVGWIRVADGGACGFCQDINGAFLKSGDAMPLHNGCGCGMEPVTGEQRAAQRGLTPREVPEWQREGEQLFQRDLTRTWPDYGMPLPVPESSALTTFDDTRMYRAMQTALREPARLLSTLEDLGEVDLFTADGSEKVLSGLPMAQEVVRQVRHLSRAIETKSEPIPEGLLRITGMDHLSASVLRKLAAGESVELREPGFLGATREPRMAASIAKQTAKGNKAVWRFKTGGGNLVFNATKKAMSSFDEWLFAPGTRFFLKEAGTDDATGLPAYEVTIRGS